MAAGAAVLGGWFGGVAAADRFLLALAAACATGFGNTVNDLADMATDRVSHPRRPLVSGAASRSGAVIHALGLAALALAAGQGVSPLHAAGVAAALAVLLAYALWLKRVPLAGNIVVASLVAYPLVFGALRTEALGKLWIPAALAFLLNAVREVVKDIQDEAGDRAAGIRTSAALAEPMLRTIPVALSLAYLALLFVPAVLGHFGPAYALVCCAVVVPIHVWRSVKLYAGPWRERLREVSLLLKLEMVAGLAALALGWRW